MIGVVKSLNFIAVMALIAACHGKPVAAPAPPPPPPPIHLHLTFVGGEHLNPDNLGQPAPVVVRYYQLSDVEPFNQAGFYPLYDQDEITLKLTLLSRGETIVPPGGSRSVDVELIPATRAIGILVAFRDVRNALWRATLPIDRPKPAPTKSGSAPSIALTFKLNENTVAVATVPNQRENL